MRNDEIREFQTDHLTVIARGVHSAVYEVGDKQIAKLCNPEISCEQVEREWTLSREARLLGVPSAETGEMIRCGNRYGILFEKIDGVTLGHAIAAEPERLPGFAEQYAALVKKLHRIRTGKTCFTELKTELRNKLPRLQKFCTEADLVLLEELTESIREENNLLHGDLHPGNIMVRDGELVLIDLAEMMRGNHKWDLAAIYRDLIIGPRFPSEALERSIGMKAEMISQTGEAFFRAYTGLEGEPLQQYEDSLLPLYGMNTVFNLGGAEDRNEEACGWIIPMLMEQAIRKHEESLRKMLAEENEGD